MGDIQTLQKLGLSLDAYASYAAWQEGDRQGRKTQAPVIASWAEQGALKAGITLETAADIVWALTGPDLYRLLVRECRWSHEAYQGWLAQSLEEFLLT